MKITQGMKDKVLDMIDEGYSHREINIETGVSLGAISKIRNESDYSINETINEGLDILFGLKTKKIISLYDIHYPFNIGLDGVLNFIKDEQPDEIILGGDMIDLFGISKYYNGVPEQGIYDAHEEIMGFKEILEDIKGTAPKAKIIWIDGNHEYRIRETIEKNKRRSMLLDTKQIYKGLYDKYLSYNEFYKVGKLHYTHGIYHNDNHTKKTVLATQKNVIYGHLHTYQSYTHSTLVGEDAHIAKSVPCLCKLNPGYMKGKPSSWLNGFHIAYVKSNGNFNDYIITISDGHFIYGGKEY